MYRSLLTKYEPYLNKKDKKGLPLKSDFGCYITPKFIYTMRKRLDQLSINSNYIPKRILRDMDSNNLNGNGCISH